MPTLQQVLVALFKKSPVNVERNLHGALAAWVPALADELDQLTHIGASALRSLTLVRQASG